MTRRTKNLSLDPEAVQRAERYSELHETNVSQLVSNLLMSLPLEGEVAEAELAPAVRRLLGAGAGKSGIDDYHRYLVEKYAR